MIKIAILLLLAASIQVNATNEDAVMFRRKAEKLQNSDPFSASYYYIQAAECFSESDDHRAKEMYGKAASALENGILTLKPKVKDQESEKAPNQGIEGYCSEYYYHEKMAELYKKSGNNAKVKEIYSAAASFWEERAKDEENHGTAAFYYEVAARAFGKLGNREKEKALYGHASGKYKLAQNSNGMDRMQGKLRNLSWIRSVCEYVVLVLAIFVCVPYLLGLLANVFGNGK